MPILDPFQLDSQVSSSSQYFLFLTSQTQNCSHRSFTGYPNLSSKLKRYIFLYVWGSLAPSVPSCASPSQLRKQSPQKLFGNADTYRTHVLQLSACVESFFVQELLTDSEPAHGLRQAPQCQVQAMLNTHCNGH